MTVCACPDGWFWLDPDGGWSCSNCGRSFIHAQPFGGRVDRCTISVPGGRCRCRDHLAIKEDQ